MLHIYLHPRKPIDQRSDRGVLLIVDQRRIIEGPDQLSLATEQREQPPVVDVETQSLGSGIKIGAVDKESDALGRIEIH